MYALWDVGHEVTPAAEHGVNPRPPGADVGGRERTPRAPRGQREGRVPPHTGTISHPPWVTSPFPPRGLGLGARS